MKKAFKYILIAFIAILFIGTFVFLFKKNKPEEIRYKKAGSYMFTGRVRYQNACD